MIKELNLLFWTPSETLNQKKTFAQAVKEPRKRIEKLLSKDTNNLEKTSSSRRKEGEGEKEEEMIWTGR